MDKQTLENTSENCSVVLLNRATAGVDTPASCHLAGPQWYRASPHGVDSPLPVASSALLLESRQLYGLRPIGVFMVRGILALCNYGWRNGCSVKYCDWWGGIVVKASNKMALPDISFSPGKMWFYNLSPPYSVLAILCVLWTRKVHN